MLGASSSRSLRPLTRGGHARLARSRPQVFRQCALAPPARRPPARAAHRVRWSVRQRLAPRVGPPTRTTQGAMRLAPPPPVTPSPLSLPPRRAALALRPPPSALPWARRLQQGLARMAGMEPAAVAADYGPRWWDENDLAVVTGGEPVAPPLALCHDPSAPPPPRSRTSAGATLHRRRPL